MRKKSSVYAMKKYLYLHKIYKYNLYLQKSRFDLENMKGKNSFLFK